jgi:sodium transport system permease protein
MSEPTVPTSNGSASRGRAEVAPGWTDRREILGRLTRLSLKELREILRDRRTIVTLVVMPLVLYPLLALVFQRFLLTSLTSQGVVEYVIGVDSTHTKMQLEEQLRLGGELLETHHKDDVTHDAMTLTAEKLLEPRIMFGKLPSRDSAERCVIDAIVHLSVLPRQGRQNASAGEGLDRPQAWDIYYRAGSPASEAALRYVEMRLHAYGEAQLDTQLEKMGVDVELPGTSQRHALEFSGAPVFSLAALIPLILVLMTVTGAVYPAIDLTAGERERGTLEMLIAAPVPRLGLLLAKYVAVLAVALLTALVNLSGMAITSHVTGLNASLFGGAGLSLPVVIKVLLLLGLFAAFFSAVLLAITSCARSFKEAQAYIIPLMLLCLVPGVICLMPSLQFSGPLAVVPLVNIVLLARDLLEGNVFRLYAAVAVISTLFYVLAASGLAARVFGTDAILYGSQATWSDVLRRPTARRSALTPSAAAFALAIMFPAYFVLSATLAQSREISFQAKLFVAAVITILVFVAIPWSITSFHRVRAATGIGLVKPAFNSLLAAALFGIVLWPIAHEIFLVNELIGIDALRLDQFAEVQSLLDQLKNASLLGVILAVAIVPGVCEEFFFRGVLFSSLRSVTTPWRTIVAAAVLFGLFHVVAGTTLMPERFLPSTFMGLVLGWVRLRTGSVMPSMLLHSFHNGFILSVAHWHEDLAARGLGIDEATHLPALWLTLAGVGMLIAIVWTIFATKPADTEMAALPVT